MRALLVLSIIPILVALGVWEQIFIKNTFSKMNNYVHSIEKQLDEQKTINISLTNQLHSFWQNNESVLGYLNKHISVSDISIKSTELKHFAENNDMEKYTHTLEILKHLLKTAYENMAFNLYNVI
ncbi:MAG: DUF4363 family protein [Firmicutes bacterium]|nr:DUF4363 family protein [Bacillota bacterium]